MHPVRVHVIFYAAAAVLMTALLLLRFPSEGFLAAEKGIAIWWDVLFPALFPFFLVSEIMLGFGIVHFFGTLLDPLMRPLFRVPGIGGFAMAMGFVSGYPVGARLTAQLWEQKLVTREEGERLVAFTTSSDPIFLIGAVAVGFFGDVRLAPILASSHYGAALLLSFLMRFHGKNPELPPKAVNPLKKRFILARSFDAMHTARLADGRPIGTLIRDAVQSSLNLVMMIGGLVVFFSVLMEVLKISHALDLLYGLLHTLFHIMGASPTLAEPLVNGFFEVTLGVKAAGLASEAGLAMQVAAAVFVLSWGGISVHAQVVSLLYRTDLRYAPFAAARFLHGVMAALLCLLLWRPMLPLLESSVKETFAASAANPAAREWAGAAAGSLTLLSLICLVLAALSALHWFSRKRYNGVEK
jgi:sporulation integral membrane protein YlbJ